MALKLLSLLVLWDLAFFIQNVTSFCNVTCTTDYETSLNCSCSGSMPAAPIQIMVKCRDYSYEINGSCEINPPHAWCLMIPEDLYDIAAVGTTCTARVTQKGNEHKMNGSDSASWMLSDMVKPLQPFSVQVANKGKFLNISWDINNHLGMCLSYRVRIRRSKDLLKDPGHLLFVDQKYVVIQFYNSTILRPQTKYTVDVQASFCPSSYLKGPWSEWSSTTEWEEMEGNDRFCWYLSVAIVFACVTCVIVCHFQKPFWMRKLQLITYVPRPDDFFKPLYHTYEGNFKDWVKPVFTEYDVLMVTTPVEVMTEKQQEVPRWNKEKESYSEDYKRAGKQGSYSSDSFQPHSASLLHFHEGSSGQGPEGHSTGHISIHTVTLSGEEELEEGPASRCSKTTLRSYQDGGGNRGCGDHYMGEAWRSRMHEEGGLLAHVGNRTSSGITVYNMDSQPHGHVTEPERISLDSRVSNGQSEDGYPHVDLDTIDSGFGETDCHSPVNSDFSAEEQMDSTLFNEEGSSNSNYVKQWMACSTLQEDPSGSVHELPETL